MKRFNGEKMEEHVRNMAKSHFQMSHFSFLRRLAIRPFVSSAQTHSTKPEARKWG